MDIDEFAKKRALGDSSIGDGAKDVKGAVAEPAEVDDFDYKGTLEGLSRDPRFRFHFLGEESDIEDESVTPEEFEAVVSAGDTAQTQEESDAAQMKAINELIHNKARAMAGKHYSGILDEENEKNAHIDTRRALRGRLGKLKDIDEDYGYDFGDSEDDFIPFNDTKFLEHKAGKVLKHLVDKGFSLEQLNDMPDEELYALASRVNKHENKMLRKMLGAQGGQSDGHPVLISEKRISTGELIPDDVWADEAKRGSIMQKALEENDQKMKDYIRNREKRDAGFIV